MLFIKPQLTCFPAHLLTNVLPGPSHPHTYTVKWGQISMEKSAHSSNVAARPDLHKKENIKQKHTEISNWNIKYTHIYSKKVYSAYKHNIQFAYIAMALQHSTSTVFLINIFSGRTSFLHDSLWFKANAGTDVFGRLQPVENKIKIVRAQIFSHRKKPLLSLSADRTQINYAPNSPSFPLWWGEELYSTHVSTSIHTTCSFSFPTPVFVVYPVSPE